MPGGSKEQQLPGWEEILNGRNKCGALTGKYASLRQNAIIWTMDGDEKSIETEEGNVINGVREVVRCRERALYDTRSFM